ncbi:hypothetical protein VTI74DRAFT_9913 [Chaetomium olivicolor]
MAASILLAILPLVATYLLVSLRYRRFRQFAEFPQHKPSLLWGHMRVVHAYSMKGPPGSNFDAAVMRMAKDLGNPPIMLFDLRPVTYPMVVILNHEVAEQISRASKLFPWSTPKSPTMDMLLRVTGPHSILTKQNEDWKQIRKRFNPGFAPQHLMTLLPCIVDKTMMLVEQLDHYASSGKEFLLNKLTINLTFDIIGAVTMSVDFNAQHPETSGQGEFIQLYDQLLQMYGVNDSQLPWWMHPRREWRRYQLGKKIDSRLEAMIRQKHAEQQQAGNAGSRDILTLSLQGNGQLSKELLHDVRDQIKSFLFAGHDTTGILLAWFFYEMSRSPQVLKNVRVELDEIFGPDPDPAVVRDALLGPRGDEMVHRMVYTSTVIKEVLRLYPPAGTARMAPPGSNFTVRTPDGQSYCLDGKILYNCATVIHRDRTVYGETVNDFIPERWLGDKSGIMSAGAQEEKERQQGGADRKYPPGAWRPFERGPRNCIGQDFATIEARVIVAIVARRYDFVKVGLGELDLDEKGRPVLNEKGQYKIKSEMYNTSQITSKPVDSMRMTVRRRS